MHCRSRSFKTLCLAFLHIQTQNHLLGGDGKVRRRATHFLINGQKRKQRKEETVEAAKFAFGFIYSFFKWANPGNSEGQKQAYFFELAVPDGPIHLGVVPASFLKSAFQTCIQIT